MRIVLFLVTFFARAQDNNLLDDLTVLIEDFTDGSGFSFDENFPDVNVNTANVTAEIIEQIETQFDDVETDVLMQIMTPIFGASLTDEELVDTFQGLIEAVNVETFVQELAESIPGLNEFFDAESAAIVAQIVHVIAHFNTLLPVTSKSQMDQQKSFLIAGESFNFENEIMVELEVVESAVDVTETFTEMYAMSEMNISSSLISECCSDTIENALKDLENKPVLSELKMAKKAENGEEKQRSKTALF